jgi:hypothetical protein
MGTICDGVALMPELVTGVYERSMERMVGWITGVILHSWRHCKPLMTFRLCVLKAHCMLAVSGTVSHRWKMKVFGNQWVYIPRAHEQGNMI